MTLSSSMTPAEAEAYRAGLAERRSEREQAAYDAGLAAGRHLGWAIGNAAGLRTGFAEAKGLAEGLAARAAQDRQDGAAEAEAKAMPFTATQWREAAAEADTIAEAIRAMEPPA